MHQSSYSRVLELIDLIEDRNDPDAYFRDFETLVENNLDMDRVWRSRELEFEQLNDSAWIALKEEAKPYLNKRSSSGRGWSQLINILNQARGYIYLSGIGCTDIKFIPTAKIKGIKTPDLEAMFKKTRAVCEVKTIGISDIEVQARCNIESRDTETKLTEKFLEKFDKTLDIARKQLVNYDPENDILRVVFIVLNFDDWSGEYKKMYYQQIDTHLAKLQNLDFRIVFFNSRTVFHQLICMSNAIVINE